MPTAPPDIYSETETARRRDEVIRRMASTPPQPRVTPKNARHPRKQKLAGPDRRSREADKDRA